MTIAYYLVAFFFSFLTASIGGYLTVLDEWYYSLIQPSWKPDDFVFPIAWTTIFSLCAVSAGISLNKVTHKRLRLNLIACFFLNATLNVSWSYLYFSMKRPELAMLEVIFLWGSILLLMVIVRPMSLLASILLVPYLIWVTLASALNYQTAVLNGYL